MGLYKNSVIPEKYMWLMGLAASAAMKCEYCVHANKFNAVKAGANIEHDQNSKCPHIDKRVR